MAEVEGYTLAWHPEHGGAISFKLQGQGWSKRLPVSSADLAAFAAVMQEKPVQVKNGWFHTGPEPVGAVRE